MRYALAAALLLICSSFASASDGVLTDHVPPGATPEQVLSVVMESLLLRGWHVESSDSTSINAAIDQVNTSAKIRIELHDDRLIWNGTAIRRNVSTPFQGLGPQPVAVPNAWIKRISYDVRLALSSVPRS